MTLLGDRVLVIAAHPDDAELAVGGTIAALTGRGADVTVAVLTVSETASDSEPDRRSRRVAAAEAAAAVLGHQLVWVADGRHDQVEDLPVYRVVTLLDDLLDRVRPDTVISHWDGDSHTDHVRLAQAVVSASRRWPQVTFLQFGPNEHRTIRHAQFVPTVYVPMGSHSATKARALSCYSYPGQGFRALDLETVAAFDRARGAAVGTPAAEGLVVVRHRPSLPAHESEHLP
ncbi:PIG-L deacetylase family protein [Streptomyces heilongjiangensis]|uniref:PIG-L deacetylase family protein n=1 Tax=Streptomyces heilongjiangensis TaxID=945052 RepID=A0ABW1BF72_9ACTN|nr:PIG-L deacetylase family protein [Streptomyces heilongjiangensis]MDC2950187.1 PIG-L family deacetylase [Streptomyces heilongjiangensis]